jgi:hypothetical protein
VTYQVKDQFSPPPGNILKVLAVHEDVSVVDSNVVTGLTTGDSATNANGIFLDGLVVLNTVAAPLASGDCE